MSEAKETLLEFPCRFPIKVMGLATPDFSQVIIDLVTAHAPDLQAQDVDMRASTGGKYLSLTVTVNATSQAQLDAIYRSVTEHPLVKYVL